MIDLNELIEKGMPSIAEVEILDEFGDKLDQIIKGENKEKPNALFLARITWNGTREIIWRVYDPEIADSQLKTLIDSDSSPREFDYRIDPDEKWELAKWHLKEYKSEE